MSEFARLEEKLAKLRQRERIAGEGRKLRGKGGDALLAALVAEIDETILPRRLSLVTPQGPVHLAVANRRLQALLAPVPGSLPEGLADHALPDIEDPKLAELGQSLKTLLAEAENIPVTARRLDRAFGSDIGVPAVQLPRIWTVAQPTAAKPDDILSGFLADLGDAALAWLRIEGEEVTLQGGEEAAVAALSEQAAIFLDSYFGKFDAAYREPSLACGTVIAPADGSANAVFFVEIGEFSAIIHAPAAQMPSIASDWQRRVAE
ncbi:MAG: hypothetical protein LJE62_05345 [Silicimonas sp.]|jgi:hypothetical protein|nr:hypothetical protein [Silicimonas sp.]